MGSTSKFNGNLKDTDACRKLGGAVNSAQTTLPAQTTDFLELTKTETPEDIQAALDKAGVDIKAMGPLEIDPGNTIQASPIFFAACLNSNPDVLDILKKAGADVNEIGPRGRSPLMIASAKNTLAVVNKLLTLGAHVQTVRNDGRTAIMYAAQNNQDPEVINALLNAGADVMAQDYDGNNPLMYAASVNSNLEVITTLLKAGADVNAQNDRGFTSLMYAASGNQNPEVITTLLTAGADAKAKDSADRTAFNHAKDNVSLKGTDVLNRLEEASR
jgi:ankyrin repeat protein